MFPSFLSFNHLLSDVQFPADFLLLAMDGLGILLSSPPFRTNNMKVEASDSLADLLRTAHWARLALH